MTAIITLADDNGEIACSVQYVGGYNAEDPVHACAQMCIGIMTELCTAQPAPQPEHPSAQDIEDALQGMRAAAQQAAEQPAA